MAPVAFYAWKKSKKRRIFFIYSLIFIKINHFL